MCRSNDHGGRRCPSSAPEERSRRRRATKALSKGEPLGPGGSSASPAVRQAQDAPNLLEAWQPERLAILQETVRAYLAADHLTPEQESLLQEHGGAEGVTCIVGAAMAAEVERRAGISGESIRELQRASDAAGAVRVAQLEEQLKELKQQVSQHPLQQVIRDRQKESLHKGASDYALASAEIEEWEKQIADSETGRARDIAQRTLWALRGAQGKPTAEVLEGLAKLSQGYRDLLAQMRPMGGTLGNWAPGSQEKALTAIEEAGAYFPSDWIAHHQKGKAVEARWTTARPHYREENSAKVTAEILVSEGTNALQRQMGTSPTLEASVHEMSHRMQYTVPGLSKLEYQWLERRTTMENGQRERLRPLFARSKEMVRADKFVTPYIGKEYKNKDGSNRPGNEVMSVAMESLFCGSNGGLVGVGKYDADEDMRSFALGALATVGRPVQV